MNNTATNIYTCPLELTQIILSKKWSCIILWRMRLGAQRLRDLKNDIVGCNEKMLIEHINMLLEKDIIEKIDYDVYPKKTEYILTEKGLELLPILKMMQEFGTKYLK